MARKHAQLEPSQKVIWWKRDGFDPGYFVIAWICAGKYIKPFSNYDGKLRVRVTNYEKDVSSDRGVFVSVNDIQPYSDEIWSVVERVNEQEEAIAKARKQLYKGKLPVEQMQLGMGL